MGDGVMCGSFDSLLLQEAREGIGMVGLPVVGGAELWGGADAATVHAFLAHVDLGNEFFGE